MTQWDERNFATDMDWTDMGVRTVELPPNLFNQATPTIVPVEVEEVLQYFDNNPQFALHACSTSWASAP